MMSAPTPPPAAGTPVPLGGRDWCLWSTAMVRGAGFPARAVSRLADPALAALADRPGAAGDSTYRRRFQEAAGGFSRELGEVAASAGFRLAVGWQNRRFLQTAVGPYLRQLAAGGPANSRRRTRERAITTYWQRYCLKNESIGFFGPTAWATVDAGPGDITARPGPGFTDRTAVHLERWPVEAVARTLTADFDLEPWLRPRRNPLLRLAGRTACLPGASPTEVDAPTLALLRAADGTLTARDLAGRLCARHEADTEDGVFARMARLRDRRWLIWRLELSASLSAEDELVSLVARIDDDRIRTAATARIRVLVDGRDRLRQVWNDPVLLPAELDRLAVKFTELTGVPPTRHDGRAYGGRTLAYPECRRDVSVRLGADFTRRLAPIIPVLDSVRWLTWRLRQDIEPHIEAAHRTARERAPTRAPVDVGALWLAAMGTVGPRLEGLVVDALAEFHRRWAQILPCDNDKAQVHYTTQELAIGVKKLLDAPHSGWAQARTVCPDVLVAAEGPDAVERGRYRLVLGEIHPAMNSLDYVSMAPTHRHPETLLGNLDATFPAGRLLPLLPPESLPHFTVRSHPALIRPSDQRLALVPHTPLPRTGTVRFAADAVVRERGGGLVVVVADGTEFDVMDLFAEVLKSLLLRHFDLLPLGAHRPRIVVDDLVLAREGWQVPVAELAFAGQQDAGARFAAARAWARGRRLPRRVFVKSPVETKPFHVDLASPVLVDVLAAAARRAARNPADGAQVALKITEMLPGPDQVWLTDSAGERYTSEFRFTLCDLRGAPDPGVVPRREGHPVSQ